MSAMIQEQPGDYLTAEEAAVIAQRSIYTIYRAVKDGKLKAYRPGGHGHIHILRSDLDTFLKGEVIEETLDPYSWEYQYADACSYEPEEPLENQQFWWRATVNQKLINLLQEIGKDTTPLPLLLANFLERLGTTPFPPPEEAWRANMLLEMYHDDVNHIFTAGELKTALEKVRPE